MTDQEILTKAIEKANANSGKNFAYTMGELISDLVILQEFAKALWGEYKEAQYDTHDSLENDKDTPPLPSTYSSDVHFKWLDKYAVCRKCSKSLRTYDQRKSDCGEPLEKGSMGWEYHLQRMVISEEPIKYIEENMA